MTEFTEIPALASLRLVKVWCDDSWSLVSLAHRVVLADSTTLAVRGNIPQVVLTQEMEALAAALTGKDPGAQGFPGWDAVCRLLEEMFPLPRPVPAIDHRGVLEQVVEALYPGGDTDAIWSPDTLEEIASIVDQAGLVHHVTTPVYVTPTQPQRPNREGK